MTIVFILYYVFGNIIFHKCSYDKNGKAHAIFNLTYAVFLFYLLWTHSLISNPAEYYLGNADEYWFYEHVKDISKSDFADIPELSFDYTYLELPFSMLYFSILAKISILLGIDDF